MDDHKKESQDNLAELKEKLAECGKQRDEFLEGWKRAKADFINYKREEASRIEALAKFGNEALILELIGIMNSFDLGLTILKDDDPARRGMHLIQVQLEDLLRKYGLQRISVTKGQQFDPELHEAVAEVDSGEPANTVIEEIERGYALYGKVVRPARVKLSKGHKSN